VAELRPGEVEKGGGLVPVGSQVGSYLLVGEGRPFVGPAARVPYLGGHVPDDEHDVVAHTLEPVQHQDGHGVAEVDFGAGRVDTELGHEGPARSRRLLHARRQGWG